MKAGASKRVKGRDLTASKVRAQSAPQWEDILQPRKNRRSLYMLSVKLKSFQWNPNSMHNSAPRGWRSGGGRSLYYLRLASLSISFKKKALNVTI